MVPPKASRREGLGDKRHMCVFAEDHILMEDDAAIVEFGGSRALVEQLISAEMEPSRISVLDGITDCFVI